MATQVGFKQQLKEKRNEIDAELENHFNSIDATAFSRHGEEAWDYFRDFSLRPGKRIRGSLVLVAYDMFGGKNKSAALKAAVAVELIQNYLLIIDDVMDRSTIRRGKPTIQHLYYKRLESAIIDNYKHTGDMLAINVGLLAVHEASRLLESCGETPSRVVNASKHFHTNIQATGFGQVNDLFSGIERLSEEDILLTHELKSSHYTFINPMQVGAILAGASEKDCDLISEFGSPAGIAFQLQDDIIGLFGEKDITGKSDLDDLKEGKYTLIIQQALQRSDRSDASIILSALGNQSITPEQAELVKKIAIDSGAKQYAEKTANDFAEQAGDVIKKSNWPEDSKRFLNDLMTYIVERIN